MRSVSAELVARIRQHIIESNDPITTDHIAQHVRDHAVALSEADRLAVTHSLQLQLMGAGPLQPLIDLPGVTDVLVNAPDEIWVDRGHGLQRSTISLTSQEELRTLAKRLAANAGCRLDDACPSADGRLPDGTRLHVVLAPIVPSAAVISLRVPQRKTWQLAQLADRKMMPPQWQRVIEAIVAAKLGVIVSGATGAGKSTVLAALIRAISEDERILLIEETRELILDHPHLVSLQARRVNAEGAGELSLGQLVKESLRMRPDRIVVGEVRGAEIRELLLAFNTGHRGGAATMHANSAGDVPSRLTSLGQLAELSPAAVTDQVVTAFQVVLHVSRCYQFGTLRRFISAISILANDAAVGMAPGRMVIHDALTWDGRAEPQDGPGLVLLETLLQNAQEGT